MPVNITKYIHDEVVRQKSTKFAEMYEAWQLLNGTPIDEVGRIDILLMEVAKLVEPEVNAFIPGTGSNLRTTEVGFMNGGKATKAIEVREQFHRLCGFWSPKLEEVDPWVKTLLEIHPWADGNGRTASLIRNFMLNNLNTPEALPYYFGE